MFENLIFEMANVNAERTCSIYAFNLNFELGS